MYIIKSGEVEVLVDDPNPNPNPHPHPHPNPNPNSNQVLVDDHGGEQPLRKIDHLYRGRCFGERALV